MKHLSPLRRHTWRQMSLHAWSDPSLAIFWWYAQTNQERHVAMWLVVICQRYQNSSMGLKDGECGGRISDTIRGWAVNRVFDRKRTVNATLSGKSQNVLDFTLFVAFPCLAQVFQGISGYQGRRLLFLKFCLIQNTTSVGPTVWLLKRWTRFEKCLLSMVQKYMLTSGRNPKIKAPILLQNKRAPPALQSFARVTSSDGLRTVDSRRPQISSDAHSAPFF